MKKKDEKTENKYLYCKNCDKRRYFGDLAVYYCGECFEIVNKEDKCILSEENWRGE